MRGGFELRLLLPLGAEGVLRRVKGFHGSWDCDYGCGMGRKELSTVLGVSIIAGVPWA